jgi:hypothetical protein
MPNQKLHVSGHSGIGKSLLYGCFNLPSIEPFRVRPPRNRDDEAVCISPDRYADLVRSYRGVVPLYQSDDGTMRLYPNHAFFQVRGREQVLFCEDLRSVGSIRLEIYGPVLLQLIERIPELGQGILLLLNPLTRPYCSVSAGRGLELLQAVALQAIAERSRTSRGGLDLADAASRCESLAGEELDAWRSISQRPGIHTCEILAWPHFEYRYQDNRINQLLAARQTLLTAFGNEPEPFRAELTAMLKTEAEIAGEGDLT